MPDENLSLFGGDWTERKLEALQRYLTEYSKVLSKRPFNRLYIDAFAGSGYREQKLPSGTPSIFEPDLAELSAEPSQRFLDGSPRIALRVTPSFHRFIFVECDVRKIHELEKLRVEFPEHASKIDIRADDANATIRNICSTWDKRRARGVLFLDPFGMQVEWDTIQAVAATKSIDTWILFPFAANRLMTQNPQAIPRGWRTRLNSLFGTPEWESRFYRQQRLADIFGEDVTIVEKRLTLEGLGAYYRERLDSVFPRVAPNPRILRSNLNRPLFQLFFAAANPGRGGDIALRIASYILDKI